MKSTLPERRLIPKWRPVANTLETAEGGTHNLPQKNFPMGNRGELERAIADWKEHKSPGLLGEVLSFSVHPDLVDEVLKVASDAIDTTNGVTNVQASFINDLLKNESHSISATIQESVVATDNHPFQDPIRRLRNLLRSSPSNALALLDLAQLQAAIGKTKGADRSIRMALNLAPNNRLVIRTAARFLIHEGNTDQAHQLVRRHPRTATDPWLMASEIALADAAGAESSFLSKGKRFLIDQRNFASAHLTELSGAIAMEEIQSGNLKKARDAQRIALISPNDNMIAHAFEYRTHFGIQLESPQILNAMSHSNEAMVLKAWTEINPEAVEKYAKAWHSEEPFSSRPVQLLSTIYLFKGDYVTSDRWISAGLVSDPADRGLLVNQAFIKAHSGQRKDMAAILRKLRTGHSNVNEPYALAIEGLYEYSQGQFEFGDKLYGMAIEVFKQLHQPHLGAYCELFQALAAGDFNHPKESDIVASANASLNQYPTFDAVMLLSARTVPDLQAKVPIEGPMRKLSQLVFDPEKNTLTIKHGITSQNAKALLVKGKKS